MLQHGKREHVSALMLDVFSVPGCIDLSGCFKILSQLTVGAKLLCFATGLRFSRVLCPPCLGVIHEIIHSLSS